MNQTQTTIRSTINNIDRVTNPTEHTSNVKDVLVKHSEPDLIYLKNDQNSVIATLPDGSPGVLSPLESTENSQTADGVVISQPPKAQPDTTPTSTTTTPTEPQHQEPTSSESSVNQTPEPEFSKFVYTEIPGNFPKKETEPSGTFVVTPEGGYTVPTQHNNKTEAKITPSDL